jgi:hypothetical protein
MEVAIDNPWRIYASGPERPSILVYCSAQLWIFNLEVIESLKMLAHYSALSRFAESIVLEHYASYSLR